MNKTIRRIQHTKKNRSRKKLRQRWKRVNSGRYYSKWISMPNYMSQKIFDNDLVAIRKSKVTLTLIKPAYVGMCISDLSKVIMYEFH